MLTATSITKAFGQTLANDRVSLSIGAGEIMGLVGQNGAGKSTLLSILAGFLQPDSGSLAVDGLPVDFASPRSALAAGIGLVHQHLSLVPTFTVREQLELAGWRSPFLPDDLATDFDGHEVIEHLPMGRRQRIEISRSMVRRPKVLLLDEPTSILAPSEVAALFATLQTLRRDGVAILIVTHKLREVMTVSDRIVVMAGGKVTGTFGQTSGAWPDGIESAILGRMFDWETPDRDAVAGGSIAPPARRAPAPSTSATMLRLTGVSSPTRDGSQRLTGVDLQLCAGQIQAIVGIDGQGQTELAEAIAGYRSIEGDVESDGQDITNRPAIERSRLGIALLLDDRLGEAAIGSLSIADNLVLKRPRPATISRWGFFRRNQVDAHARSIIEKWDVHPSDPGARFGSLSGGNMQRVLAGRELDREPRVLVALNPVQGLDVQTADVMWSRLRGLAERGGAVLIFTTDLDEAFAGADRCAVIFNGRVSPLLPVERADRHEYGAMMVNGW